ncbi:Nucleotide-binding universal stress protein, UspA family [Micromonospora phaseoli]|uniref:Nucleotide-binding universal stress protein, UspA family n=1 Tax=Micromonospora phaseoli TaxID=1144548 RepID=A0A1H6RZY6_9ACTN|nr:universal stress protein [Micromonospora phaseoli]PZW03738.1 nucleotide-binding universal stress UspA family protein [Micromonospora phaseoli]GIJ81333.1 universal stress protein [Micromonospora phaseoli]SEI61229.1 Nucleotide-binding universal stress protein, UspA family [Micromonospora phaseoli]
MAAASDAPVLVGVGPDDALPVVRLAAQVAAAHGRALHLLHAFNWAAFDAPAVSGSRTDAEQLIAQAVAAVNESEPGLPVTTEIAEGSAVANLVRRSEVAFLVVVGDGGMAHCDRCIPADSPAVQVAARADCPVLVARRDPPPAGPVLVGVDGSASAEVALSWAFACAARHSSRLLAIWVVNSDEAIEEATERLGELVSRYRLGHHDTAVECHVIRGEPGEVLVDQSRSAQLVVVAARGEEPWRGMLGAVSQSLLYHAPAPVIVVRGVSGPPSRNRS